MQSNNSMTRQLNDKQLHQYCFSSRVYIIHIIIISYYNYRLCCYGAYFLVEGNQNYNARMQGYICGPVVYLR